MKHDNGPCQFCFNDYAEYDCCNREWCQRCYGFHEEEMHSCPGCLRRQDGANECEQCARETEADSRLEAAYA